MKKIMDTKGICEIIIKYNLIFKITNNIEKIRKNPKITIFEKNWGALDPPRTFWIFLKIWYSESAPNFTLTISYVVNICYYLPTQLDNSVKSIPPSRFSEVSPVYILLGARGYVHPPSFSSSVWASALPPLSSAPDSSCVSSLSWWHFSKNNEQQMKQKGNKMLATYLLQRIHCPIITWLVVIIAIWLYS